MKRLEVKTAARAYTVSVGAGLLERAAELIPPQSKAQNVVLFEDARVASTDARGRLDAGLATLGLRSHVITSEGEASKTVSFLAAAWERAAADGVHRGDLVLAFGGGATTDVAGFFAASFHRGMPWVAIPTTLLGMVDAAIGGKTALDLAEGKNLVGAFWQPIAVISDVTVLHSLPQEEFATGMAEVIKHALLVGNGFLDEVLAARDRILSRDPETLEWLVSEAAAVKVRIVSEDETEQGSRVFLNYGHTLAHALETLGGYRAISHCRAVAIGMMFAAHLAVRLGYADRTAEHRAALEAFGLPVGGAGAPLEAVVPVWQRDKKYDRGMRFVVLEDIGDPAVVRDVPDDAVRAAYEAIS